MLARAVLVFIALPLFAETGQDAWLRYASVEHPPTIPATVVISGTGLVLTTARDELIRGVRGMTGHTLRIQAAATNEPVILLSPADAKLPPDAYRIKTSPAGLTISASNDRGVLYGVFALLRKIAMNEPVQKLDEHSAPAVGLRWINQWDNLDGSIERGYGGRSIFWDNAHARADLSRVSEYGRLLASLGITTCAINNVNADPRLLSPALAPDIQRIAEAFRPWGVRVAISVDFGSPKSLGGLDTFDPVDSRVADWWLGAVAALYHEVPDIAGFVLKADSEGRVGPSVYKRTHADAANVVARALKPHGGILLYRGFVYDHHMDWRNPKNDRARAAYDNFKPLDGLFDDNVILQIKNGPIDFQVREPVSPLFGALEKTGEAVELQIAQEYMGQSRHVVFLIPQWKEVLDFDTQAKGAGTPVKSLVRGFVGVSNVGLDAAWFGSDMSQANLYGFGRLAWDPNLSARRIAEEWTRLTFGNATPVVETIVGMQLASWRAYENYTGPLGLQTLTDIVGNHYGVSVEASERNSWGQWHNADEHGAGMDRTAATGTGYISQYRPGVAVMYESLKTCPDDLLLFMHHVPYTHVLHSGKTVIQSLYDSHYEGAATAAKFVREWKLLKGHIDDQRYEAIRDQLDYQSSRADIWRDAVNRWFRRASGIEDAAGRVGSHPGRTEAESMSLDGYAAVDVHSWEAASGGKAVTCANASCSAMLTFHGAAGWYTVRVGYFDQNNGVSRYRLLLNGQSVDEWNASGHVPSRNIDGSTGTERITRGLALRPGDTIRVEGMPDSGEPAPLDYVEIEANEP